MYSISKRQASMSGLFKVFVFGKVKGLLGTWQRMHLKCLGCSCLQYRGFQVRPSTYTKTKEITVWEWVHSGGSSCLDTIGEGQSNEAGIQDYAILKYETGCFVTNPRRTEVIWKMSNGLHLHAVT